MQKRKLKVYEKTQSWHDDYYRTKTKQVPAVILSGEWLKKSGFNIGDSVEIEVVNEQITIRKI